LTLAHPDADIGRASYFDPLAVLLQECDDINDIIVSPKTWKQHLRARNLGSWVFEVFPKCSFVPNYARVLVRVGVAVPWIRAGFTSDYAFEDGADLILGAVADLMAGPANVEDLLAGSDILSQGGCRQCGREGRPCSQRRPSGGFVHHMLCPLYPGVLAVPDEFCQRS
jgi:hypothetical protein